MRARISAAIANAFMVCSLAGMACPVHTGRGVAPFFFAPKRKARKEKGAASGAGGGLRAQLAKPALRDLAQTGALIRMFYLAGQMSFVVIFMKLAGAATSCFGAGSL